jgi:hypothetical protein
MPYAKNRIEYILLMRLLIMRHASQKVDFCHLDQRERSLTPVHKISPSG